MKNYYGVCKNDKEDINFMLPDEISENLKWYVVHTYSGYENTEGKS